MSLTDSILSLIYYHNILRVCVCPSMLLQPEKPCVVDPGELVRGVEKAQPKREDMTEEERELQDSIFKAAKAPQEKYKWPMTANQMIGWSWKDANEFREDDKKWLATHAQSEIVKYNENYVLAFGKSPFAR